MLCRRRVGWGEGGIRDGGQDESTERRGDTERGEERLVLWYYFQ